MFNGKRKECGTDSGMMMTVDDDGMWMGMRIGPMNDQVVCNSVR